MKTIHRLPSDIIDKIAAGESIERPAYVVKELMENSIDAGATSIRIDIMNGGLDSISIHDNGIGMSREDIQESFKPHTTSKIHSENDLQHIRSMGFRGEALASIAAVSNVTIQSKTKEEVAGTEVTVDNGKFVAMKPCGMQVGTTVIVENLFHSMPARKKFLKSSTSEFRLILQLFEMVALAHSHIRFFLTHNKKVIVDLPTQSFEERVKDMLSQTVYRQVVPLTSQHPHISIKGFIAKPQSAAASTHKQFIFVNNRTIQDKHISQRVREAYGTLLPPDKFPIFVLFIQLPYEMVDVNVHPRKEEIRFYNAEELLQLIHESVSASLAVHNLTFQDARWQKSIEYSEAQSSRENFYVRDGGTSTYAAEVLKKEIEPWNVQKKQSFKSSAEVIQLHNLYLAAETKEGFVLFDQHAVHERILYEQLISSFKKKKLTTQQYLLKKIITIDLSYREAELLRENLFSFEELGFSIEEFSGNTFKISAIPELFKDRSISELIVEMIANIEQNRHIKDIDIRSHRMLTYIACRSAIKAGDKLTKEECKKLLQDLQKVENPYTCPHGRPTQIQFSSRDLAKLFKRK